MDQNSMLVDSPNSSLFQDDLLMQIVQCVENGYPMGPSFTHALGTLIEGAVLHNLNYFDPLQSWSSDGSSPYNLSRSSLLSDLSNGGALHLMPPSSVVNLRLKQLNVEHDMTDLAVGTNWTYFGTDFADTDSEVWYIDLITRLLAATPDIFLSPKLLDDEDRPITEESAALVNIGMHTKNLIQIEGQNVRLGALQKFCQPLRLNLYSNHASLAHHFGAIKKNNSNVKKLYNTLTTKIEEFDRDGMEDDSVSAIEMPELCRTVLRNCKGDISALSTEILSLREKNRHFRKYLTTYDEAWRTASSKRERVRLQNDFNNAWESLVKKNQQPRDRVSYKLWDVSKNPINLLSASGDELVKHGRELAISGQVKGLHTLWADLLDAPTAQENFSLLASFGQGLANDEVWDAHKKLAEELKKHLLD